MQMSGRIVAVAAAVIVAVVGAETYMWLQEVQDLRQSIAQVVTKIDDADIAARQAGVTAGQAMARADQAAVAAAQALSLATAAREAAEQGSAAAATDSSAAAPRAEAPGIAKDLAEGRTLALQVCSACHVVSTDQHFAPTQRPPAPDFHAIANQPATTASMLRDFMLVPHGKMPDLMLVDYQVNALVAYVTSLRDKR